MKIHFPFPVVVRALLFTLVAASLGSFANAQGTTAQIVGKVADQTGAVIPNAPIDVQNTGTGLVRHAQSTAEGSYVIPSLPVGTYTLNVSMKGFKGFHQSGIVLEVGQSARIDVSLQIGATSETIEVSTAAVQVDTTSGAMRTEIDSTQIKELPLNTRNTLQLLTLVPGVGSANLPVAVINQRSGPTFSVNGSRVNGSEISLDGAVFVTALYNSPVNLPNPDAIGEFSLLTNSYSAEFGHASGGAFVAVSKSGTNTFHGSAWEFLRNDALNARNWFAPAPAVKPLMKQNQFGVAGGGPIMKNKAFFFATYEGLRIHQVALQNFSSMTPAQRAGDFSAIATPLVDPFLSTPTNKVYYTNNQIPKSEWDPLSANFMNYYIPVANTAGQFIGQWATNVTGNQFTVRGDYKTTKRDLTYVRFFRMNSASPSYTGNTASYNQYSEPNQGVTVRDTHTFAPNLIGDFGYSDTNITTNNVLQGKIQTAAQMGANYAIDGTTAIAPAASISGLGIFASGAPWYENTALKQIDAKLSWVKGKNLWQFGFLFLHEAEGLNAYIYTAGVSTFSTPGYTGNAIADFLIGRPTSYFQRNVYNNSEKTTNYSFYAQDDFKIIPRLTLNLGLRYDLQLPWQEAGLQSSTVVLDASYHSVRIPSAPGGYAAAGDPGVPNGLIFTDKVNFAPRLGFAYDVFGDGKTSVRGGYGIFYNAPGAITVANAIEPPPFSASLTFTPHSFSDPYTGTGITNPFPFTPNPSKPVWTFPSLFYSPNPHIKNAFTQQFNLNVQHEFPKDFMVQAAYVGSLGNRLWYARELNYAPYAPGATAQNAQSRRLFQNQYFAGITGTFSDGYSNYNSLQVTARKRFSAGYTMQMAYTFAKSLDTGSSPNSDATTNQDPTNLFAGEYARSDFYQKQLFRLNGVWSLPKFENLGFLRYGVGGWQLSGILNYSSGTPFSVTTGAAAQWLGSSKTLGRERLNLVGNPCAGCGNKTQWTQVGASGGYFDKTAYATPANGVYGNSGRNSLLGPSYFGTDMSLAKNFPFLSREGSRVQFRADFFNLLNNVNFNGPTSASNSSSFGKITSANNARQVQLALRLDF
jgi:hypothetical protein